MTPRYDGRPTSALACTLYYLGDFETARQYAMRGVQIWRSGGVTIFELKRSSAPAVSCLCFKALSEWHFGEIVSCHASMAEAISLAKELNYRTRLALALHFGVFSPTLRAIALTWNAWHRI